MFCMGLLMETNKLMCKHETDGRPQGATLLYLVCEARASGV